MVKKKEFSTGFVYRNSTNVKSGAKSLDEFNCISKEEEKDLCLREQGLTDEEIILKHKLDSGHLKEVYIYIISTFLWISLDLKILPNVRMDIFPI